MQHIIHHDEYDTAILIKQASLVKSRINEIYLNPTGLKAISFSLDYAGKKKPSASTIHEYLGQLLPSLDSLGIKDLLVCDGEYFKKLCKVQKADPHYGAVLPVAIKGYEHMNAVLCPNHASLLYNPTMIDKIEFSLDTMVNHKQGTHVELGTNVIHSEDYPSDYDAIKQWLDTLLLMPALTCDIEAYSLKHYLSGIGSVGFAWDCHNGISFAVDSVACEPTEVRVWDKKDKKYKKRIAHNKQVRNEPLRALLKDFFEKYQGTLIYHNSGYDITVLIYQLWMGNLLDQEGLLEGLEVMTRSYEDTLLIAYLATNSCTGNKLGLKDQAHEFTGNYAESDINDIQLIPMPNLLRYNNVDCMATWFVMDKHYDTMVLDEQFDLYQKFKVWQKDIIQIQLTGMCLSMPKVLEAEHKLQAIFDTHKNALLNHPIIQAFESNMRKAMWQKDWDDRKKKAVNPENIKAKDTSVFDEERFNPNSGVQLQKLLYEDMGLPVVDKTKTGAPATGGKTLKKLTKVIQDEESIKILNHLRDYAGVAKILSAFIPVFKEAPLAPDGMHYLFGSFKLGGTVSGRLSSKNPNLQQIPSGSDYAKVIKACFVAPPNHIFVGADFASLEDRIDALLTKDPNKIKVYTMGFDGHSYRAYYYFGDEMTGIDPESAESINSIQVTYKGLRQDSKAPTFALTYDGTWRTMVTNLGWSEDKSKMVESNYLKMYAVSKQWKTDRLIHASNEGYATVAFGLRVRTPLLKRSLMGTSVTTSQAAAESRTVGNAMGQSYGLLNNRAFGEFIEKVRSSAYKYAFRPCALIHDAIYGYVRDDWEALAFVNKTMTQAMEWQELPEIWHDEVKLGGDLDVFYPSWANDFTLPRTDCVDTLKEVVHKEVLKRKDAL
ncbi:DNA-directed DNA polymerase, family A, palm domain [Vibrio phage 1.238.A._10N.261.52.F10]|uniref:DNA-directed DNA polymerase, family A, palm domain n=1 Tax=Vibrio phage 1.238.A._10N.261.52.F10 TaxID=1881231 RepID=A0A2I7RUJ2_9CAUD|nr:DNA polymerase [Vibrio phage 1.238.A._10N.261.52.F10]AUR97304.1 DNA-directed DNA polymerase, family A, palm domain [Vibrio phage 1.238.A._10N.261.52.F10]AUR97398.1 DNA-directed DNA polymerase, family A, palm domain [Vibrio phage 1.238.B._10N.261.52.F10]